MRSILTLEESQGLDKHPTSIFDCVLDSKNDFLCLADTNLSGFLQAAKECEKNKLKLIFGWRGEFCLDITKQDEASLKTRATYIVFIKNLVGYRQLIKIYSQAAKEGFYYNAAYDFSHLKKLWTDDLILAVPFYDSFLHLNSLEGQSHVPDFSFTKPIFLLEENDLPFDDLLRKKVINFAAQHGYETLESQTIYYKSPEDFIAYMTYKCIQNRSTIEKPELNHCCSDKFNYERWKQRNESTP
jgi:DNA polymerase III alpha subunit